MYLKGTDETTIIIKTARPDVLLDKTVYQITIVVFIDFVFLYQFELSAATLLNFMRLPAFRLAARIFMPRVGTNAAEICSEAHRSRSRRRGSMRRFEASCFCKWFYFLDENGSRLPRAVSPAISSPAAGTHDLCHRYAPTCMRWNVYSRYCGTADVPAPARSSRRTLACRALPKLSSNHLYTTYLFIYIKYIHTYMN